MSDNLSLGAVNQTITYNEIPGDRRDPDVLVEVRPNYTNKGPLVLPSQAFICSQMTAAGKATAGQVYPITADGQSAYLFGAGSVADRQITLFRLNNRTTPLFAAGLADPVGGVAAEAFLFVGGASFPVGFACTMEIGGMPVAVSIPAGTNQNDLAAAVAAAVNANPNMLVTASLIGLGPLGNLSATGNLSNVLFVAKNAGLCGNEIPLRVRDRSDASAPAVVLTIWSGAPGTVGLNAGPKGILTGGLGAPDVTPVLAATAAIWFTDIAIPWTDTNNRAVFTGELMRRYGALVNLDARGWIGVNGTYATVAAFGDGGNSHQLITVGIRGTREPSWAWAAAWCGVHAFRLANDPSRQSKGIAVLGLSAPDPTDQWLPQERDLLLRNGISTWTALNDGTVVIGRTITGYLMSNLGIADTAWLDVMTPATMTAIRYDWRAYVKLVYPQAKLFDDDSVGAEYDDTAVTPRRMRGSWAKRCQDYERAGWIEGSASTIQQGYFVRNVSDRNRLDQEVVVTIVGNLMIEATALEFAA